MLHVFRVHAVLQRLALQEPLDLGHDDARVPLDGLGSGAANVRVSGRLSADISRLDAGSGWPSRRRAPHRRWPDWRSGDKRVVVNDTASARVHEVRARFIREKNAASIMRRVPRPRPRARSRVADPGQVRQRCAARATQ
jgi:hypothetical protein